MLGRWEGREGNELERRKKWEGSKLERWDRWDDSEAARLEKLEGSYGVIWERWGGGGRTGSEEVAKWER